MAWAERTFGRTFCEVHHCSPEEFKSRIFWRCLHRRAWPFARLIRCFKPNFFKEDLWLVEEAGHARNRKDLGLAVISFHEDCRLRAGFLHDKLLFRISGRRLLSLLSKTLAITPQPPPPVQKPSADTTQQV
jgi:hypothetical protein